MLKGRWWVLKGLVLAYVVAFFASFVLMFFGLRDTAQTPYGGFVGAAFFVAWCVIGRRRPWVMKGFLLVLLFLVLSNLVAVYTAFALRFFGLRDIAQTYGGFVGATAFIVMCVIGWRHRGTDAAAVRGRLVSPKRSKAARSREPLQGDQVG